MGVNRICPGGLTFLRRGEGGGSYLLQTFFSRYSQNIYCFDQKVKTRFLKLNFRKNFFFFQFKIWSEDLSKGMTIKTFINYVHLNKVQMFIRQGRTQK